MIQINLGPETQIKKDYEWYKHRLTEFDLEYFRKLESYIKDGKYDSRVLCLQYFAMLKYRKKMENGEVKDLEMETCYSKTSLENLEMKCDNIFRCINFLCKQQENKVRISDADLMLAIARRCNSENKFYDDDLTISEKSVNNLRRRIQKDVLPHYDSGWSKYLSNIIVGKVTVGDNIIYIAQQNSIFSPTIKSKAYHENNSQNLYEFLNSICASKSSQYPGNEYKELKQILGVNELSLSEVTLVNFTTVSKKIYSEFTVKHEKETSDIAFEELLKNMKNWFFKLSKLQLNNLQLELNEFLVCQNESMDPLTIIEGLANSKHYWQNGSFSNTPTDAENLETLEKSFEDYKKMMMNFQEEFLEGAD